MISTVRYTVFLGLIFFIPLTVFGANIGLSLYHDFNGLQDRPLMIEKLVDAGVDWVKIEIRMDYCEPEPGVFIWPTEEIEALAAQGLTIVASISYTPGWANGYRAKEYPCSNPNDWYAFIEAAVQQFNDEIDYWGIWNEPGARTYFRCDGGSCVDTYVNDVLLPAAQAIRNQLGVNYIVAPQTNYENSGQVNPNGNNGVEFLKKTMEKLEQMGQLDKVDFIAHHIFKVYEQGYWSNFTEYMTESNLFELIQYYNKPFWVGDFGWKIPPDKQSDYAKRFTDGIYELLNRCNVDRCFIYMFNDNQYIADYYGMVFDGMPYIEKKHYYTVRDYQIPQTRDLVFECETDFFHLIGRVNDSGWEASTSLDNPGFLMYGPYTESVKAGYRTAIFTMTIDNNSVDNIGIARLEVTNPDYALPLPGAGKIIASREITRQEFSSAGTPCDFSLDFYHHGGDDRIEFRVYWHDKSYVSVDKVRVPGIFNGNSSQKAPR